MAERYSRGAGERIVGFCFGALACAIFLTLAIELLKSIWPWLLLGAVLSGAAAIYVWRIRRW